jgi:hypothetical protein
MPWRREQLCSFWECSVSKHPNYRRESVMERINTKEYERCSTVNFLRATWDLNTRTYFWMTQRLLDWHGGKVPWTVRKQVSIKSLLITQFLNDPKRVKLSEILFCLPRIFKINNFVHLHLKPLIISTESSYKNLNHYILSSGDFSSLVAQSTWLS